mgnify:CR=1 FL=1
MKRVTRRYKPKCANVATVIIGAATNNSISGIECGQYHVWYRNDMADQTIMDSTKRSVVTKIARL